MDLVVPKFDGKGLDDDNDEAIKPSQTCDDLFWSLWYHSNFLNIFFFMGHVQLEIQDIAKFKTAKFHRFVSSAFNN